MAVMRSFIFLLIQIVSACLFTSSFAYQSGENLVRESAHDGAHEAQALYSVSHAKEARSIDLSCSPALCQMLRDLPAYLVADDFDISLIESNCPAFTYLLHCIENHDCFVPASVVVRAVEELGAVIGFHRSYGSIKQLYAISAELASIGLGPNFTTTATTHVTKVAPQFSSTPGGIQNVLIGVSEPGSTQPVAITIGNTIASSTGVTTIDIGGGPQPTAITIGNTNPLSVVNIPGNVVVTGTVTITGTLSFDNLTILGDAIIGGDETVMGNLTVMGPIVADTLQFDNLTLAGTLTVAGTSTLNGLIDANAGATIDGGPFTVNSGNNQIALTSTQAANSAIALTADTGPLSGITASVGATGGFNVINGPARAQLGANITGALMQSGGLTNLNAGANTVTLTSTNPSISAIQAAGNTQITGTTDAQGLVTAEGGLTVTSGGVIINNAGGLTVTGNLTQSGGALTLQANADSIIDATGAISLGTSTAATAINIGHAGITTTITGGLTQMSSQLTLTPTGTGVIDVVGAPGTLMIGAATSTAVTVGNRTAATNSVTLEAGNATGMGGVFIGTSDFAHIIDIGTGNAGAGMSNVIRIGTSNTPANVINIGGNASTTTVSGALTQMTGFFSLTSDANGIFTTPTTAALALNIGPTSSTVTIGNTTGATTISAEGGNTGGINIGTAAQTHTINIGTGSVANAINIAAGTVAASAIGIGGNASSTTIHGSLTKNAAGVLNLSATGSGLVDAATTLMIGTMAATAVNIGNRILATNSVTIEGGSSGGGGIFFGVSDNAHTIRIGTGTGAAAMFEMINIGTGTSTNTIGIGGGANSTTAITGTLNQMNGPLSLTATVTGTIDVVNNAATALNIGNATATMITIGNPTAITTFEAGNTGGVNIARSDAAHTLNIGNGGTSTAQIVMIGSRFTNSRVNLLVGSAAGDGIRYRIGSSIPLSPVSYSLPSASTPATVRIADGLLMGDTIIAAGTGDWTATAGVITFSEAFTASSAAYITVLNYGTTNPIGNAVTPAFNTATINTAGSTLTIGVFNAANYYSFIVIGR